MTALSPELQRNLRHNFIVNLLDGGFFGFAIGIASFVTVIPLFVNTLSSSTILIGLIPAIHSMGWQLPQLLTGHRMNRLSRFKPMTLFMTVHERVPFIGLGIVAYFASRLGNSTALALTFTLLVWQGLGGGMTATAWQSLIGKVIPADRRGTFFGLQSATANLFAAVGAFIAGFVLERVPAPLNFTLCFLAAGTTMVISLGFLGWTREPAHEPHGVDESPADFWGRVREILRADGRFRGFILARIVFQLGAMGSAFYIIYAVRNFAVSPEQAGFMTTLLMATQIVANPITGWLGDRISHLFAMQFSAVAMGLSALLALLVPGVDWFYPIFVLNGIGYVGMWTSAMSMTLEFGDDRSRPAYIGLSNSLLAPATILFPILGGWLADTAGYSVTFGLSVLGAIAAAFLLGLLLQSRTAIPQRREAAE